MPLYGKVAEQGYLLFMELSTERLRKKRG